MSPLFWILLAIVLLVTVGWALVSLTWNLLWFLVGGFIIGALARLLVPGTRGFGLGFTVLAGIAGSLLGGAIAEVLDTGGLMELLVSILTAAVVVAILLAAGRGGRSRKRDD